MARRLTNLDLVNKCDAFPNPETDPSGHKAALDELWTLVWDDGDGPYPIGYIPTSVFGVLTTRTPSEVTGPIHIDLRERTVALFRVPDTEAERTKLVARLTAYWRANKTFRSLNGWRNELWPVYSRSGELLFSMERSAMGLFGTTRYGVHMTAFVRRNNGKSKYDFRIWVPKRSANKSTYPGMLDNTVAGGLMTNEDPFECIIREADEEASLPENVVRTRATETGTVTYIYITDERSGGDAGYIYPECQWVYDLELPDDIVPEPKDGEVESFSLRTVEEIQEQLAQGLWKPNCAVVMLDFFLRHGIYTPENEPDFEELQARAHRYIPFPGPHQNYHLPSKQEIEARQGLDR
ncbi:NUDIX hydrolase domain-like protein [Cercophora newfieldiana]|uniref:NUDIX hydrolase domain-like protein n=1 Tax=Cercophora newfieldiana TaxID=92897 RepID=A0AA40CP65_9PEZI|nr:NUDIX hydrolase domain-like protein [Cercophora newfieldiana]